MRQEEAIQLPRSTRSCIVCCANSTVKGDIGCVQNLITMVQD